MENATPETTPEAQLEHLLQLAQAARIAHASPQWKIDAEAAIERHSDACETLWGELYRLLNERAGTVERLKPPPDERKLLRRAITIRLKAELPGIVTALVDEVCSEEA